MNKMILKRADGGSAVWSNTWSKFWDSTSNTSANTSRSDGNSGRATGSWLGSLLDNAGNIIGSTTSGIASIVAAKNGNYPPAAQVDNTPKILAIAGVGALVLIVVLFIIFKK